MVKTIRDRISEKRTTKRGFDEIHEALLMVMKDILASIPRKFTINIEITCKIAGVGATATFEHDKDDIPSKESLKENLNEKLEAFLDKLLSKAKERIIDVLNSENLITFEVSAGTESIPAISWITDVNFKVTINLK